MDSDGARTVPVAARVADAIGGDGRRASSRALPSALYRVELDGRRQVTAHIAERMDRNFVRVLVGDRVRLELSPTGSSTRGRIVGR